MYYLAFHLPYYATRSSADPVLDLRHDANGRPLRKATDVSFLDPERKNKAFMYSAHTSCVINGLDLQIWVAYMFVDNFFDGELASDSVQRIERLRQEDDYMVDYDPFTSDSDHLKEPISDPRELFVCALNSRLNKVKLEWVKTVGILQKSLEVYEPIIVSISMPVSHMGAHA